MEQTKKDVELGRFLSLVLRHNPSAAGIKLDAHGWADVKELLAGTKKAGKQIDNETLERIVRENAKQRYSFDASHKKIRANQGHSLPVELDLEPCTPPSMLYHGTASHCLQSIYAEGICHQNRQQVHLSAEKETAVKVGSRHGRAVVLPIDAAAMAQDGLVFFCSANGVWLCEHIPKKYIKDPLYPYGCK